LRHGNGAGPGDLTIAGPLSNGVICVDALDISQDPPASQAQHRRARPDAALQTLAVVAELFSAAFVAERWKPHKPLKIGIHQDLVDRGVPLPGECRAVFRWYCLRLIYQRALAAGGPRFDLDGSVAGEVTPDEIAQARAAVARIEAKAIAKAEAARAKRGSERAAKRKPTPPSPSNNATPQHDGELKAAASARRGVRS
jgi:sRNA-binding protein